MNLISLSIDILWLAIGIIIICAVIWVAFWGIRQFVAIPPPVEKMVWAVVAILILIAILSMLAGGGGMRSFRWFGHGALASPALAAYSAAAAFHLQGLLK